MFFLLIGKTNKNLINYYTETFLCLNSSFESHNQMSLIKKWVKSMIDDMV